ncbi:IclR family transcriptional regulator [Rhodococcus sp. MSC1_016]|uniref:IclR family transcriptional regulator n=1 Tax=Rhodococcus sp. MSC1_016 TaxID=2909266 RepID=UPI00202FEA24|nr:IclR family transcriptional regulator [Rhodococcus sp. MSC1_016]
MSGQRALSGYRDRNSTADRALDVLLLFRDDKLVWTATEIADGIGVARSTGYRYLQSLVNSGFIEESANGFRLGPRIFMLAQLARASSSLSDIALPAMKSLAEKFGETVLLTRRSGRSVVCIDLVESAHAVRLSYERGHVLPINAGAAAEALLAWAPQGEVTELLAAAPLERFTAKTITDPTELQKRLAQIRKEGVAVSHGELDDEILGVAAPIYDAKGAVIAALSIAAVASRIPSRELKSVKTAVRSAAAGVSEQLAAVDY